jgi:hypothetical protein
LWSGAYRDRTDGLQLAKLLRPPRRTPTGGHQRQRPCGFACHSRQPTRRYTAWLRGLVFRTFRSRMGHVSGGGVDPRSTYAGHTHRLSPWLMRTGSLVGSLVGCEDNRSGTRGTGSTATRRHAPPLVRGRHAHGLNPVPYASRATGSFPFSPSHSAEAVGADTRPRLPSARDRMINQEAPPNSTANGDPPGGEASSSWLRRQ